MPTGDEGCDRHSLSDWSCAHVNRWSVAVRKSRREEAAMYDAEARIYTPVPNFAAASTSCETPEIRLCVARPQPSIELRTLSR